MVKSEINDTFKLLFPDVTGFGIETDKRNLEIRKEVEEKLESLIADNHTGLQIGEKFELPPSDKSFAYKEEESEGIPKPKTTTAMANAKWSIMPGPGGRRRPSSKKYKKYTYIKKNQKKSKRTSNTKRIRRIR
jgi:hypothetical protein